LYNSSGNTKVIKSIRLRWAANVMGKHGIRLYKPLARQQSMLKDKLILKYVLEKQVMTMQSGRYSGLNNIVSSSVARRYSLNS
jgi:hypothetical protein